MLFTAGHYFGESGKEYLAVYNFHRDIFVKLPEEFNATMLAHFSYTSRRKDGGVNVFLLEDGSYAQSHSKLCKKILSKENHFLFLDNTWRRSGKRILLKELLKSAQEKYNVGGQIINFLPEKMKKEIINLTLADIVDFCGDNPAIEKDSSGIISVDEITPVTRAKYITPARYVTFGKQDYVSCCCLDGNYDPARGCISSWIPGKTPSFDGNYFHNYWFYPAGECGGCYAARKHKSFPKNIYTFDRNGLMEDLERGIMELKTNHRTGRKIRVLRLGKRVESYTTFNHQQFLEILGIANEMKVRCVIPTKFLPFDKTIKKLVKISNSSLIYSVGDFERFEKGAAIYGCTNEWRMEQARRYGAALFHNILGHAPPTAVDMKIINFAKKHNLNVQLVPRRFNDNYWAKQYTGLEWNLLKSELHQKDIFEDFAYSYRYEDNRLNPVIARMDPFWINLVGNNKHQFRMCHHDAKTTYCGNCFLFKTKGLIKDTEHRKMERWSKRLEDKRRRKTRFITTSSEESSSNERLPSLL
jgi:hypothetical protein